MKLSNTISIKSKGKKVKVGLIVVNDKNEVLALNENLRRINKKIYNIPTVIVEKFDEKEIINKFNDKYNLKINDLCGYINENYILDDACNEILQVNMWTKVDKYSLENKDNVWKNIDEFEHEERVLENLKETIEIYKYNNML